MKWIENLKARWNLQSAWQVIVVLIVFACTGFTVLFIKKPLLQILVGESAGTTTASVIYYILILPIYNVILLIYGFVFGQFHFFWTFEKRFFSRLFSIFIKNKT
ncbi:MAG: prolipoprotein diacylglyceryl transferase [Flammeovirgaceae bacterium]|nr:prolipoprotein diacylglyceryl transferase [Flammeovirgaceae bacterium]